MIKLIISLLCLFIVPGVIMGVISSYRAGHHIHRDLYRWLQKKRQPK